MKQIDTTVSSSALSERVASPRARIRPIAAEPAKPAPAERPRKRQRAHFKKADLTRAVSAVEKSGATIESIEIKPDGAIHMYFVGAKPAASLFDQWADKL